MKTYKEFLKQFEEEITNNVGSTGIQNTVIIRKKGDRKNKRKDNVEILRRLLPKKP